MAAAHGLEDGLRHFFAQREMLLGTLHEATDDGLFCRHAAKIILLRLYSRFRAKDGWMTGVRHEVGHVVAFWHLIAMWCRRIECNDRRAGTKMVDDGFGDLADQAVGNREHDDACATQRDTHIDTIEARLVLQSIASRRRQFDMIDFEARALKIRGEAHAHFSSRAQKCNLCHWLLAP